MIIRALGLVMLLLAPAAGAYLAGHSQPAHYIAIGSVLALQLSLLSRPVAGFSILLPLVYAAAAIAAQSTDGVVALIVAVAAAVGAASSLGFQRGLLAVLAAALLGSSEPAAPSDVLVPAAAMLAGSSYGFLIAVTLLRDVQMADRTVHPQTALSYAVLLAVLVMIAWFVARFAGVPHGWWLPLAVVAVGQPSIDQTVGRTMMRMMAALCGTLLLVIAVDTVDVPYVRGALVLALALALLGGARRWHWLPSVLITPILILLSYGAASHPLLAGEIRPLLAASALVFALAGLGQWMLWALRSDSGHLAV